MFNKYGQTIICLLLGCCHAGAAHFEYERLVNEDEDEEIPLGPAIGSKGRDGNDEEIAKDWVERITKGECTISNPEDVLALITDVLYDNKNKEFARDILKGVLKKKKIDVLALKNKNEETALHIAFRLNKPNHAQIILSAAPRDRRVEFLEMKSKDPCSNSGYAQLYKHVNDARLSDTIKYTYEKNAPSKEKEECIIS